MCPGCSVVQGAWAWAPWLRSPPPIYLSSSLTLFPEQFPFSALQAGEVGGLALPGSRGVRGAERAVLASEL